MSLSIPDVVPGAFVEHYFTDDPVNPRKVVKLDKRRKGYITKVEYPDNQTFDSTTVTGVWVKFEAGKEAEKIQMRHLNLIRKADEASLNRLKRDSQNTTYDEYNLDIHKSPVTDRRGDHAPSSDKTGVMGTKHMSPAEARKL